MTRTEQRLLRAEVVHQAHRCEYWLAEAQARDDAGDQDSAICLRFVARQRSDAAFAAIEQLRGGAA